MVFCMDKQETSSREGTRPSGHLIHPANNGTYGALLLYPWVVWGGLTRVAPCLLLGFRAV